MRQGWHAFRRCLHSERFEVTRKGKKVVFLSRMLGFGSRLRVGTVRKSDSDVMMALSEVSGDFAEHLRQAGSEGKWSQRMRAWAHYLSQGKHLGQEPAELLDVAGVLVRVDSRERKLIAPGRGSVAPTAQELLRRTLDVPFSVETLRVGDVIIGSDPRIYIERKAVRDLVQSVMDTRLVNQMGNQLHQSEYNRSDISHLKSQIYHIYLI